jgi:hypothetical protein
LKKFLLIASIYCFTFFSAEAQNRLPLTGNGNPIVKLYPNPATSFVNFEISKPSDKITYTLQIYNFMGRKMFDQVNMPERVNVNLTDYTRGVYIYQIRDNTGRIVESGKFQVSK